MLSLQLTDEGNARIFSTCASIAILGVHEVFKINNLQYLGVWFAMQLFFAYLLIDSFMRNTKLPVDGIIHHAVGMLIVIFGSHKQYTNNQIYAYITPYLYMEVTTPFLHLAWIFHNENAFMNKPLARIFFFALIVLWIPFRLVYPTVTTYTIFFNSYFPIGTLTVSEKSFGAPIFVAFNLLQFFWFGKLIERLLRS